MITKFSSDYYLGSLYVEPLGGETTQEGGRIAKQDYDKIVSQTYGETILEAPLVIKIDNHYIALTPSTSSPSKTVKLPQETLDELEITNPPELTEILFPTKEAVKRFDKMGYF